MLTRRSFLLDLGSHVTSAFVLRAKTHALDTGQPLLVPPPLRSSRSSTSTRASKLTPASTPTNTGPRSAQISGLHLSLPPGGTICVRGAIPSMRLLT
jgi:hypothetical protein